MSRLTSRLPAEYDAVALQRQLRRLEDGLRRAERAEAGTAKILRDVTVVRKAISDLQVSNQKPLAQVTWSQTTTQLQAKVAWRSGWGNVSDIQYRHNDDGNALSADSWTSWDDGGSDMSWVADDEYEQGGYYLWALDLPNWTIWKRAPIVGLEIRALDVGGNIILHKGHSFHSGLGPDLLHLDLYPGTYSSGWALQARGVASEALSVGFAVQATTDLAADGSLVEGDFSQSTNVSADDGRFLQSLGTFSAGQVVYVVARAYTAVSKGGDAGEPPYLRKAITMPPAPSSFSVGDLIGEDIVAGSLTATDAAVALRLGASATEGLTVAVIDETVDLTALGALYKALTSSVPSGAVILSVQSNIEAAVTAGGTTVKVGIGLNATSPSKYNYTGALLQNWKTNIIPDWTVLSSGEQIDVCGVITDGSALGDTNITAGSVRVRIVYLVCDGLDDA